HVPSPLGLVFFSIIRPPPTSPLFPYTTLFRSRRTCPPSIKKVPSRVRPVMEMRCGSRKRTYQNRVTSTPRSTDLTISATVVGARSEEHTSELQSLTNLVCRLLLEKKKDTATTQ